MDFSGGAGGYVAERVGEGGFDEFVGLGGCGCSGGEVRLVGGFVSDWVVLRAFSSYIPTICSIGLIEKERSTAFFQWLQDERDIYQ